MLQVRNDIFIHSKFDLNDGGMKNWTNDDEYIKKYKSILDQYVTTEKPKLLEIGTYKGTSAIGFLELVPNSTITVVDPWLDYGEFEMFNMNIIENIFDHNIASSNMKDRIVKKKGFSGQILRELKDDRFQFIYVDGNHEAFYVLHDLILAWELLENGGIMMIDDYTWNIDISNSLKIPYHAVNYFLKSYKGQYEVIFKEYVVCLKKTNV